MKKCCALLLILTIVCASNLLAQGRSEFSIAPTGGFHFGHTAYRFELLNVIEDSLFPAGTGIGSELIFPLDFNTMGVKAEFRYLRDELPIWTITAHFRKGVTDPGDVFTDRDWYAIPNGLIWNFSWTESKVDGDFTELGIKATRLITAGDFWDLSLLVAFDYKKFTQKALGFSGAQHDVEDISPTTDFYVFTDPRHALDYEITYLRPRVGLTPRLVFSQVVSLTTEASYSPVVRIDDTDDHLLRFFTTKADGRGWGIFTNASLRFEFGTGRRHMFLAVDGDYSRVEADLGAVSTWYGDDPIDAVDNTGWRIAGIPHEIRSSQYGLEVRLGLAF